MKRVAHKFLVAGLLAAGSLMTAVAQTPSKPVAPPAAAKPAAIPAADNALAPDQAPQPPLQLSNVPGTVLMLRGLDKITGRPTDIAAPIGKAVHFATLTITARYCYSTPASETPETSAFLQIEDHRPDQGAKRVFSGWMYASSPGLQWHGASALRCLGDQLLQWRA